MKKTTTTTTTELKYAERLALSQSQKDDQDREFQVEEAKQQLASDILNTKKSLVKAERAYQAVLNTFPFDSQRAVEAQLKIEEYQDGLERLEILKVKLF